MNKREKEKYKKRLEEKKKEIIDQLSEIYNESKEVDPGIAQDIGDKAESSYTKEFLLSLSDVERDQLLMIDDALKRIKECSYGICQMCNKKISIKRINAVPWTSHCINCQEKAEEESI